MIENSGSIEPDIGTAPDLESSSDAYASRFSGAAGMWLLARQSRFTEQHIQLLNPRSILDVGGGHAQNVELVESLNKPLTVTGTDESCRVRLDRVSASSSTVFVRTPLANLSFAERSFQHVISYRIVSHMDDWRAFVGELCRVSDDAVTVDFASRRSVNIFSELAFKLKSGQESDTRRYHVLPESDVDQAFAKHGFQKVKRSPQFFYPMAIHRKLKSPKVSNVLEVMAKFTGLAALFGSPIIVTYRRAL